MKRTVLYTLGLLLLGASIAAAQTAPTPPQGTRVGPNFVDANGDGICDNYQARPATGQAAGKRHGARNGGGNNGVGPRDGTGFGARSGAGTCTGTCNGTGQGKQYRGGRK
jgi:hypothetical protein